MVGFEIVVLENMSYNYNLKTPVLAIVFSFLVPYLAKAQNSFTKISSEPISVLPVTPNAASLGRYFELPSSSHTGVPEISIPLWDANIGDITLPITLAYHAGGIKVDEISSWVGLGWSLSAGGCISRTVRGLVDQTFSYAEINQFVNNTMSSVDRMNYVKDIVEGRTDSEPDLYHLSVNGISCQFFLNASGEFVTSPRDIGLKIQKTSVNTWLITDKKGIKYSFIDTEHIEAHLNVYSAGSGVLDGGQNSGTSSWYVSKIEDSKGNRIDFTYTSGLSVFYNKAIEKVKVYSAIASSCTGDEYTATFTENRASTVRLESINYSGTVISFNVAANERLDLPGDHSLSDISIKYNNDLIKKYTFFTSHFINNQIGTRNNAVYLYRSMDQYRLRLDSLREQSLVEFKEPYKFHYIDDIGLPYRLSNAQDEWGYFNGMENSTFVSYPASSNAANNADKKVNHVYSNQFTLNEIIYPTGGSTTYEYEGNKLYSETPAFVNTRIIEFSGDNSVGKELFENQQPFTITADMNDGRTVQVIPTYSLNGLTPSCECLFEFFIQKVGESPVQVFNNQPLTLSPGNYIFIGTIVMFDDRLPAQRPPLSYNGSLSATILGSYSGGEISGPGIRVKKVVNNTQDGQAEVRRFDYKNPTTGKCSGMLGNTPEYIVEREKLAYPGPVNCVYKEYSSQSNYPLINSRSSYVGYSYVVEYYDDSGNSGKKVSRFTNFDDYNDLNAVSAFPFKPHTPQSWKRGLTLHEWVYEHSGDGYQLKAENVKKYEVLPNSEHREYAIKAGILKTWTGVMPVLEVWYSHARAEAYPLSSDAFKLVTDSSLVYDSSLPIKKVEKYEYALPNYFVNKVTSQSSTARTLLTEIKYPHDLVAENRDPTGILASMVEKNIISPVIEQKTLNNNILTSSLKLDFIRSSQGLIVPGTLRVWNPERLIYEVKFTNNLVDDLGNIRERSVSNGVSDCFIYSYKNHHIVAEIKNATYAVVESVLGGASVLNAFSSSSPTDEQVKAFLLPLRNSTVLKEAQVTSYTHKPSVGISSITNPQGQIMLYEYDTLGQLQMIKDIDGKVVKRFDYHYKP